jgi:hypothetical protein
MNDAKTNYLEKMKKKLVFGTLFAFIEKGAHIGRLMFDWVIDLRPQEKDIINQEIIRRTNEAL